MKIKTASMSGFTLMGIMIVVDVIGLLAAIAIPNFVRARTTSQQDACINNLRQIDGAIQEWALENKKDTAATVAETDVTPYLKNSVVCPSGGTTFANSYTLVDVVTAPVCKKVPSRTSCRNRNESSTEGLGAIPSLFLWDDCLRAQPTD